MKRFYSQAAMTLLASLLLLACDNKKKDYPTDYVGLSLIHISEPTRRS